MTTPAELPANLPPRRRRRLLGPLATIAPAAFLAWFIARYAVDMLFWDEWVFADLFVKAANHRVTLADLWEQYNESRKFFPRIVMIALALPTKLDVRAWMAFSFVLACATVAAVAVLARRTQTFSWPLVAIASLILLSPAQYQNWLWGIQIVVFIPAFCLSWGLVFGTRSATGHAAIGIRQFVIPALFATIATYSYSNGMLCWALLLPALFLHWPARLRVRLSITWVLLAAAEVAAYFVGYVKPPWMPELGAGAQTPFEAVKFFLAFQGQFFLGFRDSALVALRAVLPPTIADALVPDYVYTCVLFGVAFLALYTLLGAYSLCHRHLLPRTVPWLMFGAYSIASGALTTIGRMGLGAGFAATPRYRTFGAYLPVAVLFLAAITLPDYLARYRQRNPDAPAPRRPLALARCAALALAVLTLLLIPNSFERAASFRLFELQGKGCLAFVRVIETTGIRGKVADQYGSLRSRAVALDDLGMIHPPLVKSETLEPLAAADKLVAGQFDALKQSGHQAVATGWAILPDRGEPADVVVLAYQTPEGSRPFAIVDSFHPRPDVAQAMGDRAYAACGWSAIFPATAVPAGAPITAWAFDALTNRARKLDGQFTTAPVTAP